MCLIQSQNLSKVDAWLKLVDEAKLSDFEKLETLKSFDLVEKQSTKLDPIAVGQKDTIDIMNRKRIY